jgi:hypothetical protein
MRLTRATAFGALHICLAQHDDPSVVEFLLSTEIIPLSLRIMENGSELSRTVSQHNIEALHILPELFLTGCHFYRPKDSDGQQWFAVYLRYI